MTEPTPGSPVVALSEVTAGGDIHIGDKYTLELVLFRLSEAVQQLAGVLLWLIDIFSSPVAFFRSRAIELQENRQLAFARCIAFSFICILLGLSCAIFLEFEKPSLFGIGSALGVFLIWFVIAMGLHPLLRAIKAKGSLTDTAFVFLICASALHVIWIPVFSVVGKLSSQTKVRIEYKYLVTYGYGDWHDVYLSPLLSNQGKDFEVFIKEEQPEKVGTVLAPLEGDSSEAFRKRDRPIFSEKRLPISAVNSNDIKISESAVLARDALLLRIFPFMVLGYYVSHYLLLAVGLGVIHQRRFSVLFALALLGPIAFWGVLATLVWFLTLVLSELS